MQQENDERFFKSDIWPVDSAFIGWRLDHYLQHRIPQLTREKVKKMIRSRVRVSWKERAEPSTKLLQGGMIEIGYPRLYEVPKDYSFRVLFEDENILVLDKPAGLLVHPTNRARMNTLIEVLKRQRGSEDLFLLHRLDRETSGVLMLAKNKSLVGAMARSFVQREMEKTYLAWVWGTPPQTSATIHAPIGQKPDRKIMVRRSIMPEGQEAITSYRILHSINDRSLVELRPLTGRCHQLRVHMEFLGCPILGDPLYGRADEDYLAYIEGKRERERVCLHALRLEGYFLGQRQAFEADVPALFKVDNPEILRYKRPE